MQPSEATKMQSNAKTETEVASIVVVGAMNPPLHHPLWYRQENLISEAELAAALADPNSIASPPISNFETGSISVTCQLERWEVRCRQSNNLPRILETACRVFALLPHTPVKAFGFNFVFEHRTAHGNVDSRLAGLLASLPVVIERGTSAALVWRHDKADQQISSTLSASRTDAAVVVLANNYNYPITQVGYFDLEPLLRSNFETDRLNAESRLDAITAWLGKE
jgi:hypothetical protein